MIVYMVTSGEYSDYRVNGIFSSEQKAEDFASTIPYTGRVEPMLLDEMDYVAAMIRAGKKQYRVYTKRFGEEIQAYESTGQAYLGMEGASENGDFSTLYFDVWANDEAHAIKIASEKRAIWLTHGIEALRQA
jgi:hypothetical protein